MPTWGSSRVKGQGHNAVKVDVISKALPTRICKPYMKTVFLYIKSYNVKVYLESSTRTDTHTRGHTRARTRTHTPREREGEGDRLAEFKQCTCIRLYHSIRGREPWAHKITFHKYFTKAFTITLNKSNKILTTRGQKRL